MIGSVWARFASAGGWVLLLLLVSACTASRSAERAQSPGAAPKTASAMPDADSSAAEATLEAMPVSEEASGSGGESDDVIVRDEARKRVFREAVLAGSVPAEAPPPPARADRLAQSTPSDKSRPAGKDRAEGSAPFTRTDAAGPSQVASPLLIYEAKLNVAVFEVDKALAKTEQLARDAGGYLVRRDDRAIIIRVPSRRFHAVVRAIGGIGDLLHREVTVEDVTEQFRDLEIRLRNLRAVRDRFEQLLARAQTVEEALKVQRELERVTTQIEQIQGRLKYLKELIAYSTITVEFAPRGTEHIDSNGFRLPFPWLSTMGLGQLLRL